MSSEVSTVKVAGREIVFLEQIHLIRQLEESLLRLFSEGKLSGTTHTCIGQEVCAVSVVGSLDLDKDIVFSSHRCHGHYVVYSNNPEGLIAEIMGRQSGICGGRGGSQHLCDRNFFSNGVQGGIVPVATGVALAEKRRGNGAVTVCFLGDGTLGEGAVYEALNMAALWKAPILFVLEHNRYAQSTPTELTTAGDVLSRAQSFGIPGDRRPADDPVDVSLHVKQVIDDIRRGGGPFFQVLDTYRLAAHSKGDDNRSPQELESTRAKDPMIRLSKLVGEQVSLGLLEEARQRIGRAIESAEESPAARIDPEVEERAFNELTSTSDPARAFAMPETQSLLVQNLNTALHRVMSELETVVLIGEDLLDPYGGAFKVTKGLSTKFPDRVLTSPISEAGIVGIGAGMAIRGYRPVVEIMFGDFLSLAADQMLNHAAKFHWMYNGKVQMPLVIRTPVGGRRGYGPTHSQSIEKMFFGIPGLVVVGVSLRHDPGELLRRAITEDSRPVLFIEQKSLYAKRLQSQPPQGMTFEIPASESNALYPTGVWRPPANADVTVVTYGGMTEIVEEAMMTSFEEDEILCEYVIPSQLAPFRPEAILESVRRTGRLLVVEEASAPWGFGAEVIARIAELAGNQNFRYARVAGRHLPIPNAKSAEECVLPGATQIVDSLRKLLG